MFTGLVADTGQIVAVTPRDGGKRLQIRTGLPADDLAIGESIAVNGVCLTVESVAGDVFTATAGRETLAVTTLGGFSPGQRVHLERALRVGDRLGGHLVQGHVDCVGTVSSIEHAGESWVIWVEVPQGAARYVADKGSVTLDGISLTVNEVDGARFRVNIVPHTAQVTAITDHQRGDRVNVEVDVLARYVERLLSTGQPGKEGLSYATLKRNGFT